VAVASSMSESMIALALRRKFANTLRQSLLPNRRSPSFSLSLSHSLFPRIQSPRPLLAIIPFSPSCVFAMCQWTVTVFKRQAT
jgi:hypothetical protein